jgi:hypothetical protein
MLRLGFSEPFRRLWQDLKAKNWPLFHPLVTAMIARLPHSVSLNMGFGLAAGEHRPDFTYLSLKTTAVTAHGRIARSDVLRYALFPA